MGSWLKVHSRSGLLEMMGSCGRIPTLFARAVKAVVGLASYILFHNTRGSGFTPNFGRRNIQKADQHYLSIRSHRGSLRLWVSSRAYLAAIAPSKTPSLVWPPPAYVCRQVVKPATGDAKADVSKSPRLTAQCVASISHLPSSSTHARDPWQSGMPRSE